MSRLPRKMHVLAAVCASLVALAAAVPAPKPEPQISLPPLIPTIPGVTESLTSNAPPLPILQVPTPPLPSPPFTGSNIKPKKIGYFWTGAGDNEHKDFLATYSLDDDTFGTLLWLTDVPSSGNSPHHLGRPSTYVPETILTARRTIEEWQSHLGWRPPVAPEDARHRLLFQCPKPVPACVPQE